jgi:CopG family nickel-responsive transcriptional regulator
MTRPTQRLTITVDDDLADTLDALVGEDGWANRSEAVRDLCREGLARRRAEADDAAPCVGVLGYVYDHDRRDLPRTLTTTITTGACRPCTCTSTRRPVWRSRC